MLVGQDLPILLGDEHGTMWVDNANGTVTNTGDENDGRPDQHWDDVPVEVIRELHSGQCRSRGELAECPGGPDCAEFERIAGLFLGLPA